MLNYNIKKIVELLNYFAIKEDGTINVMKALKLIWLSDRKHLITYGRTISNDKYFAVKNGPIQTHACNIAKNDLRNANTNIIEYSINSIEYDKKIYSYSSKKKLELGYFSDSDLEILSSIYSEFGNKNEFELSELSHEFLEWKRYEQELLKNPKKRFEIVMEDFFTIPQNNSFFNESLSALEHSKEIYLETVSTD